MARSAIQLIARYQQAKGKNLKDEIDNLAERGILPPVMKDWSHEVRVLGNENAHPTPGAEGTDQKDARNVVEFLGFLLTMTYDLPNQIKQFREKNAVSLDRSMCGNCKVATRMSELGEGDCRLRQCRICGSLKGSGRWCVHDFRIAEGLE